MRWESILLLAASLLSLLFTLSRARSPGSSKQLKLAKHSLLLAALLAAWNFSVAFFISLESYGKLNLVHIIGYNLILSLVLIVAIMPVRKAKNHASSLYIKTVAVVFMIISISNLILHNFYRCLSRIIYYSSIFIYFADNSAWCIFRDGNHFVDHIWNNGDNTTLR